MKFAAPTPTISSPTTQSPPRLQLVITPSEEESEYDSQYKKELSSASNTSLSLQKLPGSAHEPNTVVRKTPTPQKVDLSVLPSMAFHGE